MALYKCECNKEQIELSKATIVLRGGKWVAKEAQCSCGKYMDSKAAEGMPNLIRTEPTLKNKREKLWDSAKEKLVGERGINEPFD